jgi:hypothetical protein
MDERFDILLKIVEASVEKNGSIQLTTGHFLNILRMVDREYERINNDEYDILRGVELDCETEWWK